MRIIGGLARGRAIVAPPGEKTRPTQEYVRESLFNIIRWDLEDARVLDLFAGSGALSLEALSRGAAFAVMIDMDRAACECIRKNMETTRLKERGREYESELGRAYAEKQRQLYEEWVQTLPQDRLMIVDEDAGVDMEAILRFLED